MKKTISVSSLPTRLKVMAVTPKDHNAAAHKPVLRSKSAAVNKQSGIAVSAPIKALGNRNAAYSEIDRLVIEFKARAPRNDRSIRIFINIGCSALAVKSPRS